VSRPRTAVPILHRRAEVIWGDGARRPDRVARWAASAALLLSLVPLALVGACPRDEEPAGEPKRLLADASWPNVVLISIDTLRPDHLSCYGYARSTSPNLDKLAGEGALFEQAVSSTSWTLPAHAALFTGLADTVHGALDTDKALAEGHVTLAERLQAVGYTTAGFFSGPTLYPAYGLGQGFDTYVDCTSYAQLSAEEVSMPGIATGGPLQRAAMADISSPRVFEAVHKWLADGPRRPFFLFVHLYDCHFDFIPPAPYDRRFDPDYHGSVTGRDFIYDDTINARMPKGDLAHLIALYDGEIAWTDAHVGKIVADLETHGLKDSALLIVLSDHGTEFFEHGQKGHRHTLYDEVIRIPLLVRFPGRITPGLRLAGQVRIIDVAPTVLDLLGLTVPPELMGQTLVPLLEGRELAQENLAVSELFTMGRALRAFRRPDRKLIRQEQTGEAVAFHLATDPAERNRLTDPSHIVVQAALRDAEKAGKWLTQFRQLWPVPAVVPHLPEKVRERLQSLGYIGEEEKPK